MCFETEYLATTLTNINEIQYKIMSENRFWKCMLLACWIEKLL
jgi:hypothetical protein